MIRLARCINPACKSADIVRKRTDGAGSMDHCPHCGSAAPAQPGTIPASRVGRRKKKPATSMTMGKANPDTVATFFGKAELTGFAPAVTLGQGLPKERGGVPCHYRRKQMLKVGEWYDKEGKKHVITPERIRTIIADTKRAKAVGGWEPYLPDGSHGTKESLGYLYDVEEGQDGSLYGIHQFIGDEATINQKLATNKSSICTWGPYTDDKGNRYEEFIYHNAILPDPQFSDLEDFVPALAASRGTANVLELNAAPTPTEVQAMLSAQQLEAIRAKPGMADFAKGAENDGDKQLAALVAYIDGRETALKLALSKADDAEKDRDKIKLEMSKGAPKPTDPALLNGWADLYGGKIELLMSKGIISGAQADILKAKIKADGKPVQLMLSKGDGDESPIDMVLKVIEAGAASGVASTNGKERIVASRSSVQDPGGQTDEAKLAEEGRKQGEAFKQQRLAAQSA